MSLADGLTVPVLFTPPPCLFHPTGCLSQAERSLLGEQKRMTQSWVVAELTRSPRHRTRRRPPFLQTSRSSGHPHSWPWHQYLHGSLHSYFRDETNGRSMARRDGTTACQASAERDVDFGSGRDTSDVLDDTFEELQDRPARHPCFVHNLLAAPTPYADGWEWQKQALNKRAAHPNDLSEPDVILITQHHPVFTLGTGSTLENLKFEPENAPFDVVRTERGGEVTYHGPGQIVLYPVINLRRYRQDIHWYLRALEETVIRTLSKLGLDAERIAGLTGVWVKGRKVAAVGVRVKRWITMHGLSLNVHPNLAHFKHIVPCGIEDRPVGALVDLCPEGEDTGLERVGELLLESFAEVFGIETLVFEDWEGDART